MGANITYGEYRALKKLALNVEIVLDHIRRSIVEPIPSRVCGWRRRGQSGHKGIGSITLLKGVPGRRTAERSGIVAGVNGVMDYRETAPKRGLVIGKGVVRETQPRIEIHPVWIVLHDVLDIGKSGRGR